MAEVVKLYPAADPDEVLKQAIGVYDSVVVIGWTKEDNMSGRISLNIDTADALLLVELFKMALLSEVIE
jgi:hypothetical protein